MKALWLFPGRLGLWCSCSRWTMAWDVSFTSCRAASQVPLVSAAHVVSALHRSDWKEADPGEWPGNGRGPTKVSPPHRYSCIPLSTWTLSMSEKQNLSPKMDVKAKWFPLRFSFGSGRGICFHCRVARLFPFTVECIQELDWWSFTDIVGHIQLLSDWPRTTTCLATWAPKHRDRWLVEAEDTSSSFLISGCFPWSFASWISNQR